MWELRTQYNRPGAEVQSGELEWNAVMVDTEAEADSWWRTRTSRLTPGSVSTMFNPAGTVVQVVFG